MTTIVPRERRIDAIGFYEVLDQVLDLLQRRSQITCHALKREFQLDAAFLPAVDTFLHHLHDSTEDRVVQHPAVPSLGWRCSSASLQR